MSFPVGMSLAIARLQVAVSRGDLAAITRAGVAAAATVEFSRLQLAGGYACTRLYLWAQVPRGWVLASGDGRAAIHPENLPHVFVGERELDLVRDVCSAPAGARMLSDHVMARLIEPDLGRLTQFPGDTAQGS